MALNFDLSDSQLDAMSMRQLQALAIANSSLLDRGQFQPGPFDLEQSKRIAESDEGIAKIKLLSEKMASGECLWFYLFEDNVRVNKYIYGHQSDEVLRPDDIEFIKLSELEGCKRASQPTVKQRIVECLVWLLSPIFIAWHAMKSVFSKSESNNKTVRCHSSIFSAEEDIYTPKDVEVKFAEQQASYMMQGMFIIS